MSYSVFRGFPVVGGWRVARRHLVTALAVLALTAAAAPKVEKFVAPEVLAEADGVWVPLERRAGFQRWTDDYASTLPVLLWGHLIGRRE